MKPYENLQGIQTAVWQFQEQEGWRIEPMLVGDKVLLWHKKNIIPMLWVPVDQVARLLFEGIES